MKKNCQPTMLERRIQGIARRKATRQLMQVPWDRFHKAYEEYIQWQAFALWARAVVDLEGSAPSWLKTILRKRCSGFAQEVDRSSEPELLGLNLLSWIHNQAFQLAKQEGWLDALVFYGFRDTRSQGYWTYWEHCDSEWPKRRPAPVPTLAQWTRSALNWKFQGKVGYTVAEKTVEEYIDFEGLVCWLRPIFQAAKVQLPANVVVELRQQCPGLLEFMSKEISAHYESKSRSWQRLFKWGEDHVLSRAKKEGWLDCVLRQVRLHPFHVRMANCAALYRESRAGNIALPYLSLHEWQKAVGGYLRASRK
jgi:hypothetical protein